MTEEKLLELLKDMSLEEKIYQMVQLPGGFYSGAAADSGTSLDREVTERELYMMGSTLSIWGAEQVNAIQKKAIECQPHHIPMLFMMDVIHGFRTVFPIPLAQGAMFDPELVRKGTEIAANEAAAAGIHVAFSPMLDLVRDARWGRVMESPGEDPYLNGQVGRAYVEGFQGNGAADHFKNHVASCIKHFAGYGASTAGRDYTAAELSEHSLREYYLPAYHEAVKAGAEMVMTSFNTINGIPSSGNKHLLQEILRDEWGFRGTVISDWNAVREMNIMGFAADEAEAARKAADAGVDIEMSSLTYADYLKQLVEEENISEDVIDAAVLRILRLKNDLGLFENPYKDADSIREQQVTLTEESKAAARKAVSESLVLLKNGILPLKKGETVALIGPYAMTQELNSHWAPTGRVEDCVSVQAASREFPEISFKFAEGARMIRRNDYLEVRSEHTIEKIREYGLLAGPEDVIEDIAEEGVKGAVEDIAEGAAKDEANETNEASLVRKAVALAQQADKVVLFIGEHVTMSGEANGRGEITIPANQMRLVKAVAAVNPNVAAVVFAGRPLDLRELCGYAKSIVYAWLPGLMGGPGILDVLTGRENFSGRLPMSMPYSVSQLPLCYNEYRQGRPKGLDDPGIFTSCYSDIPNRPLFPFGYGLSYTAFAYGPVQVVRAELPEITDRDTVLFAASCKVMNKGSVYGTAVPQLYIGDVSSSIVRPLKELKGFSRVELMPGEEKTVSFDITKDMLSFTGKDGQRVLEPGVFWIYIGADCETENVAEIEVE